MRSSVNTYGKNIIGDLAEAISSFNISGVALLLSDEGQYSVQDKNFEISISDKNAFLDWLSGCYGKFLFGGRFRRRLRFNIVKCMNSIHGHHIIVFDNGRFPVFASKQAKNEQSGLLVKYEGNKITAIEFCYLVMKTESPFIYEKRHLTPSR